MLIPVLFHALGGPRVQVLDPDGHPVAGAKVVPFRFVSVTNPQPFPAVVADDHGVVTLYELRPRFRTVASMVAFAPRYGAAWTSLAYPPVFPAALRLAPETCLRLTVRSTDRKPLPGLTLRATWLVNGDAATRVPPALSDRWGLTTDATGTITIPGLPQKACLSLETRDPRFIREPFGIVLGSTSLTVAEIHLKRVAQFK